MALNRADAILLVYDAGRPETFYSLEEYWLPMISGAAEVSLMGYYDYFVPRGAGGVTNLT